jgi:hypothetical protein
LWSSSLCNFLHDPSSSLLGPNILLNQSRDSSVGIALGYGLDDRGSRVRFPAGAGNFSLHHRVQNGSGAHRASYAIGTRGSFPGGEGVGGVKLTIHLHLVPRSRVRGAIPPLPLYAFMVWCSLKAQGQLYFLPSYTGKCNDTLSAVLFVNFRNSLLFAVCSKCTVETWNCNVLIFLPVLECSVKQCVKVQLLGLGQVKWTLIPKSRNGHMKEKSSRKSNFN